MSFIDKLKEWWNEPSLEKELCKQHNELAMKHAQNVKEQRESREEKLKSYESMSESQ